MACSESVVLPLDSGPKISMTRPRGYPPTPRAASSEIDPDEIASRAALLSILPRRMMDHLPNCFSVCDTARSRARLFSVLSSAIKSFLLLASLLCPFGTLRFYERQLVADESVELVRAGRIPGKDAHAFAIAPFAGIQCLRRFETFLGFSSPIHFKAQQ